MAGHARYELTSASPESNFSGSYQNGQRASLDRSSSFREGAENRMFGFGKSTARGSATSSDVPTLSQCLMLDPIIIGDKRNAHSSELRRVLGFSIGSGSEDSSFGTSYLKNSPTVSVEELKRLRASIADTCVKASGRAKRLDEHINKLNKYDVMSSKKHQRHELMANERSTGPTLKIGSQIHRNSSELGNHKLDDRSKNVVLNKRVRSSVTETQVDYRNNGVPRPSLVAKERELVKYSAVDSDMAEEKIRRLPASGEGWDKKMKRRRSVGAVFPRSIDGDGELKRTMTHKLTTESNSQGADSTYDFRSGPSCGVKKLDSAFPVGSNQRTALKNDQEKSSLSKDLSLGPNKERVFGKGNLKLNNREDNGSTCSSSIVKGKASRGPRSSSTIQTNAASTISHVHGTLESWEQPQGVSKSSSIGGTNNRKRPVPATSSSPPITQWGGQRSNKIPRGRRTNLIPVLNQDEVLMPFEEFSPSTFGPRLGTAGTNAPFLHKSATNGTQSFKVKPESVTSPAILSESEESGAYENRTKDRVMGDVEEKGVNTCQYIMPSTVPTEKNTSFVKKEIGDGVRRQERSGRVSQFPRGNNSPLREKVDSVPSKPMRNAKSSSDKNGSKSGRRLKKLSERRGFPRFGHLANGASPDCSGESEDDHEELIEAANLAFNSSLTACPSKFWKAVELLFTSISPDEKAFLSLQLKQAEESCGRSSLNCSNNNLLTSLDDFGHEEIFASDTFSCGRNSCAKNEIGLTNSLDKAEFVQHLQNSSLFHHPNALPQHKMSVPLYQRVLSALIVEVDIEESEETGFGSSWSSVNDARLHSGSESRKVERIKFNEPIHSAQTRINGNPSFVFPCNGNVDFDRNATARDHLCNGEVMQRDNEYILSEVEMSVRLSDYIPQTFPVNNCIISATECPYEQMSVEQKIVLELQSIGLFESIPDLDDKEDEAINQEIFQLERELHKLIGRKKASLDKIYMAVQEFKNDGRCDPVQVSMDKLVELAYNKLLATRGSFASKHGISKVPKQVAFAFIKRTLARCRKFEDSGVSSFTEPAFREIIYSTPPRFNDPELLNNADLGTSNDGFTTAHRSDHIFAKNGSILSRGKKKEVLLDDVVGTAAFRASSALGILGGAKGKRSERDTSARIAVAKSGRSTIAGSKGDRKTKLKPKPKTAQLCTSGNGLVNKLTDPTNPAYAAGSGSADSANDVAHRRKDVRFKSAANAPPVSSNDIIGSVDNTNLPLNMNGMEELGIDSEVGVPHDFNSWFSFDVEGAQENDFEGLSIPMDELADIF